MRIAIDLDGTLLEYDHWRGREHLGRALPGAHEAVLQLFKEGHELIVFTTRLHPGLCAKDGVSLTEEKKRIIAHLNAEGLGLITELTGFKPLADLYIDDHGVRFYDWPDALRYIDAINNGDMCLKGPDHEWKSVGESRDDLGCTGVFNECIVCKKKIFEHFASGKKLPWHYETENGKQVLVTGKEKKEVEVDING